MEKLKEELLNELLQKANKSPENFHKETIKTPSNSYNVIKSSSEPIIDDTNLGQEIEDKKSNRGLRESISNKIFIMMASELIFIGIILTGLFLIPVLNAFSPTITIKFPNLFAFLLCIPFIIYALKLIHKIPEVKFSSKCLQLKTQYIPFKDFVKFGFISVLLILFWNQSSPKTFSFETINCAENITTTIILVAETIFVKTAVLAGMIIHGLFKNN
ncbi:MAG TPA: hypothetical protein P5556_06310 [Candidatus Gastranaerophilales bacterium]|nr:hypothetical protein [Candidatus Gastranaerophilales bacterium]